MQPFRKPKRVRTAFSPSQLLKLEHAFERNHYVVGSERKTLAQTLSLSETQVTNTNWFDNISLDGTILSVRCHGFIVFARDQNKFSASILLNQLGPPNFHTHTHTHNHPHWLMFHVLFWKWTVILCWLNNIYCRLFSILIFLMAMYLHYRLGCFENWKTYHCNCDFRLVGLMF